MGLAGQEVNIMKKFISLLFVLFACAMSYGQGIPDVTRFLGIPVDGTKAEMVSKLKAKGFTSVPGTDMLEGEFNGKDSYIGVQTNNRKVWRIAVIDKNNCDETQIRINFNNLCGQFENNSKYLCIGDQTIPESEDISYEMSVNNKRYQAVFYQKPHVESNATDDMTKRFVWFMINKHYGEFSISLFYENGYNAANGEDL